MVESLSRKNASTYINVKVEFREEEGKFPVGRIAKRVKECRSEGRVD